MSIALRRLSYAVQLTPQVKQINKRQSRLFRGVPIEVDGWAKEQPLKKQVAVDANTDPAFSAGFVLRTKQPRRKKGRERVKTGNDDNKKRAAPFSELLFFLVASGLWNGRRHD